MPYEFLAADLAAALFQSAQTLRNLDTFLDNKHSLAVRVAFRKGTFHLNEKQVQLTLWFSRASEIMELFYFTIPE